MGPAANDKCPWRQKRRIQRHKEKGHGKMREDIRIMLPLVKDRPEPSEAGRSQDVFSPRVFGGNVALPMLRFQTAGPQSCERTNF